MTNKTSSRGITMAVAITMLALVSVAIVIVAQLVRDDSKRTFDETRGAQLRAYVQAAMIDTAARLKRDGTLPEAVNVSLPSNDTSGSIAYSSKFDHDTWHVDIVATHDDAVLRGSSDYANRDNAWTLTRSELSPLTSLRTQPTTQANAQ